MPLPFPLDPFVIDRNPDPVDTAAVHVQPLGALTARELVPTPAPIDAEVGLIEYVHAGGGGVGDPDG